jgi:DNA replicative helicase MCM subunit Mcm2 (Cdc46/Mcm family)
MEMRQYPDSFNPEKDNDVNRSRFIRSYDDNNNPMEFEYGLSSFKDTQLVVIQELP